MEAFTLYGFTGSGNCEKVRMVADFLSLPYEWIETPIFDGAAQAEDFLQSINPAGQVPAIVFADQRTLAQSNAIMLYLAEGSALIPKDAYRRAQMHAWLFWEQYTHEPAIAVRRALIQYRGVDEADIDPALMQKGVAALDLMERTLVDQNWLVGDQMSLADIALMAYTRLAPEGGFSLVPFPAIQDWLARCEEYLTK
ncbi:MAG: glutathione S-transferase family protein [Robiginitomaculum sp.]|nr:glutathione S-transferase family protein [Robiginitomaculum sp.]MDQ7078452.1 glutathione S-transferase family protein [Robiginitomaculum sp.]